MINNFFDIFKSWSMTLKILPCSPVDTSLLPASCLTLAHILHRTGMQLLKEHRDLCWHPGLLVTPSLPLQISLQPLIQKLKDLLITTPAVDTSTPAQLLSLVSSRAGGRLCSPILEQSIDIHAPFFLSLIRKDDWERWRGCCRLGYQQPADECPHSSLTLTAHQNTSRNTALGEEQMAWTASKEAEVNESKHNQNAGWGEGFLWTARGNIISPSVEKHAAHICQGCALGLTPCKVWLLRWHQQSLNLSPLGWIIITQCVLKLSVETVHQLQLVGNGEQLLISWLMLPRASLVCAQVFPMAPSQYLMPA